MTDAADRRARVAICVATYRRPVGLARLLDGLARLRFEKSDAPDIVVVVMDNDAAGSARVVCEAAQPALPWPLRHAVEPRRGVSHVRNALVAAARAERATFIAFIDDDEAPDPRWLDELLTVERAYDADVVAGPVRRRFEAPAPPWIERGGFFAELRQPTGTPYDRPGAGNTLVRVAALDGLDEPFDPRFSLTGGEDTHLFLRLAQRGKRLVWASEAVAHEWVPASRATARWLVKRTYRTSSTWSIVEKELAGSPRTSALRAAKGLARIGWGLATLPASALRGRHAVVRALCQVAWGAGNLAGLAGLTLDEYRAPDGR